MQKEKEYKITEDNEANSNELFNYHRITRKYAFCRTQRRQNLLDH